MDSVLETAIEQLKQVKDDPSLSSTNKVLLGRTIILLTHQQIAKWNGLQETVDKLERAFSIGYHFNEKQHVKEFKECLNSIREELDEQFCMGLSNVVDRLVKCITRQHSAFSVTTREFEKEMDKILDRVNYLLINRYNMKPIGF